MVLDRLNNETDFEWKLRLCKSKLNHTIDYDWQEIVDALGLDISADHLRKTAYGFVEYDEYMRTSSGAAERILCISDAHVPFNLPISIYKDYVGIVDTIVINGDLLDCWSCSSFPKKYKVDMGEELVLGREYLSGLVNMLSPKKLIIVKGNHEHRMSRYLTDKIGDEVTSVLPSDPLDMIINKGFDVTDARNGIETHYSSIRELYFGSDLEIVYNGDWYEKEGNVIFAHPLSYSSGMLKTTEKAVNYFLRVDRTFTAIVMSHTHKVGSFVQGGIKMYEQGCVCDLNKLNYNNGKLVIPNQNGFMYICLDKNGDIIDSKTRIDTMN